MRQFICIFNIFITYISHFTIFLKYTWMYAEDQHLFGFGFLLVSIKPKNAAIFAYMAALNCNFRI